MRVIQLTLDEELVERVDEHVRRAKTTRSAFARQALRESLKAARRRALEERDRLGYQVDPVRDGEFAPLYLDSPTLNDEKEARQWSGAKSGTTPSRRRAKGARSSSSPIRRRSGTSRK